MDLPSVGPIQRTPFWLRWCCYPLYRRRVGSGWGIAQGNWEYYWTPDGSLKG